MNEQNEMKISDGDSPIELCDGDSPIELNVYQRINGIMKEISYIKKTGTVGWGTNSYTAVLHDHVTQQLQPLCVKHGIVLVPQMTNTTIEKYRVQTKKGESDRYETRTTAKVTAVNIDNPNETIETTALAHGFDSQDKSPGKAYSMAVKYCYLKLFMLASGDDEEQRVEQTKIVNIERQKLEDELKLLLKANDKLNEQSLKYMSTLGIDGLRTKINEYKNKGE